MAAAIALSALAPALAAEGPPRLASFQAGPHNVVLYNDSPSLVVGRNLLTLDVPAEAAGGAVHLELIGADGRARVVNLRQVRILGGARGHDASRTDHDSSGGTGHDGAADHQGEGSPGQDAAEPGHQGSESMSHGAADSQKGEDTGHGAPGTDHQGSESMSGGTKSAATAAGEDAVPAEEHGSAATKAGSSVLLRGKVELPASGAWTARVTLADRTGEIYAAEAMLTSVHGGPNRLYLFATGSLMGGALIAGAVMRRYGAAARPGRGR